MKCPKCDHMDTQVKDTRTINEGTEIKRRRECPKCLTRFTTFEKQATVPVMVVKKDGQRQTYDREKIQRGLIRACHKRSINAFDMEELMAKIEQRIFGEEGRGREVSSQAIGSIVLEELRRVDDVAFIRFASIYNDFDNIESFREELNRISNKSEE